MSPLLARRRVLAAKIESQPGIAETLAAADAAFNVLDPKLTPDIAYEEREGQGVFSPIAGVPGARGGQITFAIELVGGSSVPAWAATFLPACGLVANGLVFAPKSVAPGLDVKTLTLGLFEDGVMKILKGASGTAVFRFPAGKIARVEFTFKGVWVAPVDADILAPTYPTVAPLRFVSSSLALGQWTPTVAELTLDLGNEVVLREDCRDASGYSYAVITGRRAKGTLNPEATLLTTGDAKKDLWADWLSRAEPALSWMLGATGNGIAFSVPKTQITKIEGGERGQVLVQSVEFQANRSAAAGDDELTLTFS